MTSRSCFLLQDVERHAHVSLLRTWFFCALVRRAKGAPKGICVAESSTVAHCKGLRVLQLYECF